MISNEEFQFVARANLTLFAESASGATWGYKRRRSGAGSTVPSVRAGAGQRPGLEGADRGGIRRRHHVGDRLRHGDRTQARPQGRPRQDHHVEQIPAVQILRRDGQCAVVWAEGGVSFFTLPLVGRFAR